MANATLLRPVAGAMPWRGPGCVTPGRGHSLGRWAVWRRRSHLRRRPGAHALSTWVPDRQPRVVGASQCSS